MCFMSICSQIKHISLNIYITNNVYIYFQMVRMHVLKTIMLLILISSYAQQFKDAYIPYFTALETDNACKSNQQTVLDANADDFFLSENQLDQCISQNKELIIQAKDGQVMNISQINLDHSGNNQSPYGSVEDVKSGKQSLIGHGPRLNHLMLSTSNEIAVIVSGVGSEDNRFMLHIQGTCSSFSILC